MLEKGRTDLKTIPPGELVKKKNLQMHRSHSIEVSGLPVVNEEKSELNNSKSYLQEEKEVIVSRERSREAELTQREV